MPSHAMQVAVASLRAIYIHGVSHRSAFIRATCLTVVMMFLCLRAGKVWATRTGVVAAAGTAAAAAAALGPAPAAALLLGGGFLAFAALIHAQPPVGVGHRVGAAAAGVADNTVEALEILAEADAAGAFDDQHFPYIEFDVQETADGELVLFHDPTLVAAFPDGGPNTAAWAALRDDAGVVRATATVQECTAAQLRGLHLGGRAGVHVPTLQQFLE